VSTIIVLCLLSLALVQASHPDLQLRGHHEVESQNEAHQVGVTDEVRASILGEGLQRNNVAMHPQNLEGVSCMCDNPPCDCGRKMLSFEIPPIDPRPQCLYVDPNYYECYIGTNPLTCGDSGCMYENECYAEYAGWNVAESCQPMTSCPSADDYVGCDLTDEIYTCGFLYCSYPGRCAAQLVGWDVDVHCYYIPSCPVSNDGGECVPNGAVYVCGPFFCEYQSECEAAGASWDVSSQCQMYGCPFIQDITVCTSMGDMNEPYFGYYCGPELCWFATMCRAGIAGWDVRQSCQAADACPGSYDAYGLCPQEGPETACGPAYVCRYANECVAASIGWNVATDCETNPCPVAAETTDPCPSNFPVNCGWWECGYTNRCDAASAGWDLEGSCYEFKWCIHVDVSEECANSGPPVLCKGNSNCIYNSKCEAQAVGWDVNTDCVLAPTPAPTPFPTKSPTLSPTKLPTPLPTAPPTPAVVCPVPDSKKKCKKESNPVTCQVANGTCRYDNECFAKAAGFKPNKQCE
jgi:hypothetical protein